MQTWANYIWKRLIFSCGRHLHRSAAQPAALQGLGRIQVRQRNLTNSLHLHRTVQLCQRLRAGVLRLTLLRPAALRWAQPDTIVPEASQGTQAWDRYAYVNNSPINHNDPTGHCLVLCTAAIGGAIGVIVGAVGYTTYTVATGTEFNTGHMLMAAGGGAIAGAVIGSGVGLVATATAATTSTTAAPLVEQAIQKGLRAVQNGVGRGYNSFEAFNAAEGSTGPGMAWHHIVTQTSENLQQFGAQAIHNTNNVIRLPHGAGSLHQQVTKFYNSVNPAITGSAQRVYQWLQTQSFESQWEFGMNFIKNLGGAQHIIEQMPK